MKLDTKLIPKLVQQNFDLVKSLHSINPTGRYQYGQPSFCPFHENHDTPAAALYEGRDGSPDSLWCFAEQRQYTVVDVLGKLMGHNIYEVGHALWNKMGDIEKQQFLEQHDPKFRMEQAFGGTTEDNEEQETKKDQINKLLNTFKYSKDTLNNLLQNIIEKEKHYGR